MDGFCEHDNKSLGSTECRTSLLVERPAATQERHLHTAWMEHFQTETGTGYCKEIYQFSVFSNKSRNMEISCTTFALTFI